MIWILTNILTKTEERSTMLLDKIWPLSWTIINVLIVFTAVYVGYRMLSDVVVDIYEMFTGKKGD